MSYQAQNRDLPNATVVLLVLNDSIKPARQDMSKVNNS